MKHDPADQSALRGEEPTAAVQKRSWHAPKLMMTQAREAQGTFGGNFPDASPNLANLS